MAVLILGGVIATLGDRIGMRVGKARLSLFNLRPRQTATLVSIATGSVISASTLAILFGVSSQLRTGVFELGRIQDDLANAEAQLADALAEQEDVKADLDATASERQRALTRLQEINQSLDRAVDQQEKTQAQLQRTRDQLATVSEQAQSLRQSTDSLRAERDQLIQQQATIRHQIANRDRAIADLDRAIAARDNDLAERERRLAELQTQQSLLEQQVADLQNQYEGLFRGNIALSRNQELFSGVVRVDTREDATAVINQLLFEANRRAIQVLVPGNPPDQQVILIGNREVENLIERLSTGEEYVIRLLSAANYVIGEPCVTRGGDPCIQIFIDATANQQVYQQGERLATVSLDTLPFSDRDLVERLNLLFVATQFRARQDGVVDDDLQVADNRTETLLRFLTAVKQDGQVVELQTIAANDIFNAGPLQVEIVASRDGRTLFSTNSFISPGNGREGPEGPP
ncbi:MAG: DUF3084 domain-containing protein [Leptolyngbyaceae cyanobacterium SM2_5_2]|nr:DUF3084 domain-containing protein [Leptolyngbyaceae cyanobacterium SM2_5_2]